MGRRAERVETWPGALAHPQVLEAIDEVVQGRRPPRFLRRGRSAWMPLESPVLVRHGAGSLELRSIKLKGLGLGAPGQFTLPASTPFLRPNPHLGFTREGEFILVESLPAPLGGITLPRAAREYTLAERLFASGCPAVAPLCLYRYLLPELRFDDGTGEAPFGIVVTGLPDEDGLRVDQFLRYGPEAPEAVRHMVEGIAARIGRSGDRNLCLAVIARLGHLFGKAMRRFHENGFYRYSGNPENYMYSARTDQVVLLDLDSSRELAECSDVERPLQVMRDVASGMFNLAAALMNPQLIERFPPEALEAERPFLHMLRGYYEDVDGALLERLDATFALHHMPVHRRVHERRAEIASGATDAERLAIFQKYWMDRRRTYGLLMELLWHAHHAARYGEWLRGSLSREAFDASISAFASPEVVWFAAHHLG